MIPNRLFIRTALLFALLLLSSQLVWIGIGTALFVRPFKKEYAIRLATEVELARTVVATQPLADPQRLLQFNSHAGAILPFDAASSHLLSQSKFPVGLAQALRDLGGDDLEIWTDNAESQVWIRFASSGRAYWLVIPATHLPLPIPIQLLSWILIALLASVAGAYLLITRLNGQLRAVVEGVRTIGRGEIPPRLDVAGPEEIQELSRGFNQMSEALQRLEAERRIMLAGISHDLRSPLARLRLSVQLSSGQITEQRILTMVRDIEDIDEILEQFLAFMRDETEETPQLCDLDALVGEICTRYRLSGAQVNLVASCPPLVRVRKLALRRLVSNLIDNGLRHGGGDVEVTTECNDSGVVLTVADRGPGIRSANPAELIRPFVREDPARSTPGSGLGLTVVDRIARAHGGCLTLQNRPGGGLLAVVSFVREALAAPPVLPTG